MVDINTHEIIAAELNALDMTDSVVRPNLLKQICRGTNAISDDEAYDTRQCYATV
ncbi:Mobile element protein [Candidatus Enterovibrio altilux]|uniref:Mobile element protein n=1 Tax=Candidatus Enterovibrio altilux TaxID=1927128 RepID=A0A291BAL0_9GAMM|nr:Mobile element protein [Candidatus Enterovibrio luxaltus]